MSERLEINVPDETAAQLRALKELENIGSVTEALRRAVATYVNLERAAEAGKGLEYSTTWLDEDESGRLSSTTEKKYFRLDDNTLFFASTSQSSSLDQLSP